MASQPDPRFYKDGYGLRPRLRLLFHYPRHYLWLKAPRWFVTMVCRWNDRHISDEAARGVQWGGHR